MSNVDVTDYTPGDAPVPVGSTVYYFGSRTPGLYRVVGHLDPENYPGKFPSELPKDEVYPDGTAYDLYPYGVARKFGNDHLSVIWARRRSFRICHILEEETCG